MKLQDLLQERNQIATQMKSMYKAAEQEDRGFSADEQEKWDNLSTALDSFDKRVENEKRASSLDQYTEADIEAMKPESVREMEEKGEVTERQAFQALVRSTDAGMTGLSADQKAALKRAQATGTDSAGGYLVPDDLANQIINRMVSFGGIREAATVINTASGNTLEVPTNDDSSNSGSILAENTQDSEQDVTLGVKSLGAYKYTSNIIRVPIELLQDSAFDVEAYLANRFGERLGRATAAHYAAGTGSSQPEGLNAATSGKAAAATTAVTYLELLDLKHSVDPAYRSNARWVFNDATFLSIKKLLDGDSRPLWQPDISGSTPGLLDGDPYIIDQGMPALAASSKSICYGDISGLWIRDVMGMTLTRMVERYADYHQVGFVAIMRTDSALIDANSVRAMTQAAV